MKTIYKNYASKEKILELYDEKLESIHIEYENIDIKTTYGNTRVIKTGYSKGKPIVLFHGINAGAPLTLEAVKTLGEDFLLYAVDTIGQATKSDETVLNIKDDSYAKWAHEVIKKLNLEQVTCIGISYGSFILQKLISYYPNIVSNCILVVPSGLVNGAFLPSLTKLTLPLMKFMITKTDKSLRSFIRSFVPEDDTFMFRMQKALLLGVKIDFRRPKLLNKKDVSNYNKPTFMIVADNDIFFPADKSVKKAKQIFKYLNGVHYLKDCKHMPHQKHFLEICNTIKKWVWK